MVLVTRLDLDHRGLAFRDTGGESEGREDTGFKGRQENGEQDHRLLCWILVAGARGMAFGIPFDVPVLPSIVLLVVYGCEINSCYGNYFEAHGKKVKINIFKFFAKKADIIEVKDE